MIQTSVITQEHLSSTRIMLIPRYCYVIIETTKDGCFSQLICVTTHIKRVKDTFIDYSNAYYRFPVIVASDRLNDISRRVSMLELDDKLAEEIQITSGYAQYCWIVNIMTPYGYVVAVIHEPDRMKRIPGATRMYGPFRIDGPDTKLHTQVAIDALLSLLND
jgi:hypothetical protein